MSTPNIVEIDIVCGLSIRPAMSNWMHAIEYVRSRWQLLQSVDHNERNGQAIKTKKNIEHQMMNSLKIISHKNARPKQSNQPIPY